MPINTREDRMSAVSMLLPFQQPGVEPDPGIDASERQAAAWMYSGISVTGKFFAWRDAIGAWYRSSSS